MIETAELLLQKIVQSEKERKECESDEKSMHCDTMVFPLSGSEVSESNKAESWFFQKPKFSASFSSSYILADSAITFGQLISLSRVANCDFFSVWNFYPFLRHKRKVRLACIDVSIL